MKKILVTGGAGFIGSHTVDLLTAAGFDVVVLDNLSTGLRENINARLYEADIRDKNSLYEIFHREEPSYVIHLAAQINVRSSNEGPLLDAEVNILGSLNVIEASLGSGVEKIVYASSGGAVYGEAMPLPAKETNPIKPISNYGVSKYAVEKYLQAAFQQHNLDFVILRYANVYGPRQNSKGEAGVIAVFAERMLNNQDVEIWGDGTQKRDFVYVSDVAYANLRAIDSPTPSKIYNIGTGNPTSVNEIYSMLKNCIGSPSQAATKPFVSGDVYETYLDPSLAFREFGWQQSVSLTEGIARTVKFFREK